MCLSTGWSLEEPPSYMLSCSHVSLPCVHADKKHVSLAPLPRPHLLLVHLSFEASAPSSHKSED